MPYESGLDAAINLASLGKEVHVLSRGEPWGSDDPDPSRSLSLNADPPPEHAASVVCRSLHCIAA
ncbi:MAG: NAD(P)-binding domain-containing protein [Roseimicrobium sp.]